MSSNAKFYSLTPQKLLALTAYGEAGGEGNEGMIAAMNVVKNRVLSNSANVLDANVLSVTKSKYHAVILKPYQFSIYNSNDGFRSRAEQIADNWNSEIKKYPVLDKAYTLAGKILSGSIADNTQGATYYHANYVTPSWASSIPYIGQIGNHVFYGIKKAVTDPINWVLVISSGIGLYYLLKNRLKNG